MPIAKCEALCTRSEMSTSIVPTVARGGADLVGAEDTHEHLLLVQMPHRILHRSVGRRADHVHDEQQQNLLQRSKVNIFKSFFKFVDAVRDPQ